VSGPSRRTEEFGDARQLVGGALQVGAGDGAVVVDERTTVGPTPPAQTYFARCAPRSQAWPAVRDTRRLSRPDSSGVQRLIRRRWPRATLRRMANGEDGDVVFRP
jgi:hypothetical protein